MRSTEGALALNFDGETPRNVEPTPRLRLAPVPARLHGPDKYKVLAHRRHQAQIKARRLLELAEN